MNYLNQVPDLTAGEDLNSEQYVSADATYTQCLIYLIDNLSQYQGAMFAFNVNSNH